MVQLLQYRLNSPFKPAPTIRISLMVNFSSLVQFSALCTIIPLILGTGVDLMITAATGLGLHVVIISCIIWVQLYYESMWHELREDEMNWKRGICFSPHGDCAG
jgi:hypothetical protein